MGPVWSLHIFRIGWRLTSLLIAEIFGLTSRYTLYPIYMSIKRQSYNSWVLHTSGAYHSCVCFFVFGLGER